MRGDLALWILSKFGLVFFLFAIAGFIMVFATRAKDTMCSQQAQAIADSIGGKISQVVNSPLDDEKRIEPLKSGITLAQGYLVGYNVTISVVFHDGDTSKPGDILVDVKSKRGNCEGYSRVPFSTNTRIQLLSAISDRIAPNNRGGEDMRVLPSTTTQGQKSYYLVILKCKNEQQWEPWHYLLIQDCMHNHLDKCMSFNGGAPYACCIESSSSCNPING